MPMMILMMLGEEKERNINIPRISTKKKQSKQLRSWGSFSFDCLVVVVSSGRISVHKGPPFSPLALCLCSFLSLSKKKGKSTVATWRREVVLSSYDFLEKEKSRENHRIYTGNVLVSFSVPSFRKGKKTRGKRRWTPFLSSALFVESLASIHNPLHAPGKFQLCPCSSP